MAMELLDLLGQDGVIGSLAEEEKQLPEGSVDQLALSDFVG